MRILSRSMVCALLALSGMPALADPPQRDNVTGTWSWTSYLLDPAASRTPGKPLDTATVHIWATAKLKLTENPAEGDADPISGDLTFVPTGLTLKVQGRRVGEGEKQELLFLGSGERPGPAGKPPVKMLYEIRGGFSSRWPEGGPALTLRGYIRNIEGDPYAEKAIGAFVLVPSNESPSAAPSQSK